MSVLFRAAFAASVAVSAVVFPALAQAHASLDQREARAGSSIRANLRVPHGCEGTPTLKVRLQIPEGVFSVKPMPKAGWTLETVKGPYARAYEDHGRKVTEGVKEIIWSGGSLPDEHFDEFGFTGSLSPELADGTALYFPAIQDCARGQWAWVERPAADGQKLRAPAPVLRVASAAMAQTAREYAVGPIRIATPWTRATPRGAPVAGGFMRITNTGATADRLIGGTFPLAGRFEVHEMAMDNGVMKMRELARGLEIPAGQSVELRPGGYHVMFLQLKEQIVEGKPVSGTLVFEKAGSVTIEYMVSPVGAPAAPASGGGHSGGPAGGHGGHGSHRH